MSSEPHTIHCLRATHFAVRTGSSVTSNDFTSEFVAWFQMYTFPEYRLARIHGSVGCSSTPFTRSERCTSLRLMSRRRGIAATRGTRRSRRCCVEKGGSGGRGSARRISSARGFPEGGGWICERSARPRSARAAGRRRAWRRRDPGSSSARVVGASAHLFVSILRVSRSARVADRTFHL